MQYKIFFSKIIYRQILTKYKDAENVNETIKSKTRIKVGFFH